MATQANQYVLEEVTLSESDEGDVRYDQVHEEPEEDQEADEDYETLLRVTKGIAVEKPVQMQLVESKFTQRHVTTDDFIRNFLVRLSMPKTLETFQAEWYELQTKGKLKQEDFSPVPDVYIRNQELREQVASLRNELESAKHEKEQAKADREILTREIRYHKGRHRRVQDEKSEMTAKISQMKESAEEQEAKYKELAVKYENAMKEKMLIKLERDRLKNKAEQLEHTLTQVQSEKQLQDPAIKPKLKATNTKRLTPFPPDNRPNPYSSLNVSEHTKLESWMLNKTFPGHQLAVSSVALHPRKPILSTGSDDNTCKIWMLMNAELLITFQMTDWVACTSFHPGGGFVAAGSADSTISLWDLTNPETTPSVYREHTQPIWSIDFNDTGDFMVSASMDHSLKLWDCATARCRGSFRGHVDSVNSCKFQPYANCFISGSGDKTVSLWDMRTNQCVQTLYGHLNSINSVSFNLKADTVASCDADGVVKVWDLRMVQEKYPQLDTGRFPATSTAFDKSGTVLLVGSEDGNIYAYSLDSQETIQTFKGHEQGVQDLVFDPAFKYFVSAGGDCTFRVWS
jgi:hypothetical protein